MNILEVEDMIKGLPDQALQQEAQAPTGQVPQFLVISEIQRRTDMRKRFQEQQPNQGTVKDQIVQQGIMGAMPTPMPTGIPTGIPTGMPTGMPAQGMFNGGIIRLQEGGFLDREFTSSRPGPYNRSTVRESIEDALARGASMADLLAIFRNQPEAIELVKQLVADRQQAFAGRKFDEAYQTLLRQAQENMPDYSMIAPAGLGVSMDDLPSLPEGAGSNVPEMFQSGRDANTQLASLPDLRQTDVTLPDRTRGEGVTSARESYVPQEINLPSVSIPSMDDLASIDLPDLRQTDVALPDRRRGEGVASARESYVPQEMNLPSGTNFLSSIADSMRQTPLGEYSRAAEQGIIDVYNKDGLPAAIGQAGRAGIGGIIPFLETAVEGYKPAGRALVSTIDYLTSGPAEALDQFVTGSVEDPLTLGDIGSSLFGGGERVPLEEVKVDAKARQLAPEMKALLEAAQDSTQDASNKSVGTLYEGAGSKEVQGTSGRQAQGLPDPGRSDPLDFSDLIKESKDAAMANALMQLGAGIAGGDLSKGISAAGVAAAKGQQDAKAIAIRKRLAEYQAGREDIAREEKAGQFKKQMDLLEKKVDATLTASSATSKRENLRALAGEVASLRESLNIMSDADKARFRVLEQQLYSMLGIDMPNGDVVAGLSGKDTKGLTEFFR